MSNEPVRDPDSDANALLRVENLTKHFDTEDSLLDRLFGDTTNPVRAVDGIDFEIAEGETFGLVGESGCGKSTTGETVLQLLEPTEGSVEFDGTNLVESEDLFQFRRRSAVVFQDPFSSLDPRMTVEDIIKQPLDIHDWPWPEESVEVEAELDADGFEPSVSIADDVHRVPGVDPVDGVVTVPISVTRSRVSDSPSEYPDELDLDPSAESGLVRVDQRVARVGTPRALTLHVSGGDGLDIEVTVGRSDATLRRERAGALLERVGLSADQLDRYPNEFSGGQRQRIGIARALVLDPDFLVLDEPTSALDVSVQAQVLNLLVDLKEDFDLTYLIISHDLSVIRHVCDRVAVMYLGELVEVAPVDELFESPKHPYTKALLESVPRPEVGEQQRALRPLSGDVPSPRDPPLGCRFRTRCPRVIPPEDIDLSQEHYRLVMDLRERIENRSITVKHSDGDGESRSVDTLYEQLVEVELPADHEETVLEALEHIVEDEFEEAADVLRSRYSSVCERSNPTRQGGEHSVACHLHHPPSS